MRVGIDLDGCLYDFGNSVRLYLDSIGRTYGWKGNQPEPHHWDFYEYWGMTRDEFRQICCDGVDAGIIFSGDIRPGAVEAVQKIRDMGHQIIIITDRSFGTTPSVSEQATVRWLAKHGIEYDELIFSADKTIVPTDIFVEDKLENYDLLVQNNTPCYLIDRPWNQTPLGDSRYRIKDISEYPDLVAKTAQAKWALEFSASL